MDFNVGSINQSLDVLVVDDSGLELTGKVAVNFPAAFYSLSGPNANAAFPAFNDLASATAAYNPGGIFEKGQGVYRMDLPDGIFANLGVVRASCETSGFHVLFPWFHIIPAPNVGTGAYTVTLTVNDGTNPINGAKVRLTSGSQSYLGTTNTSGQITFNIDNATWTVAITAAGYTFNGTTLSVTADTTHTYSMTQTAITVVSPTFTTGYLTCYDQNGNVAAGIQIIASFVQAGSTDTGHSYASTSVTQTSDVNGLVQFQLAVGATYRFTRGTSGPSYIVNVPVNAGSTYALNPLIGTP